MKSFLNIKLLYLPLAMIFAGGLPVFSAPKTGNKNFRRDSDSTISVPLGGNAWRSDRDTVGGIITDQGIVDWSAPNITFSAYVRFRRTGNLKVWLKASVPTGNSVISVTALGDTKTIFFTGDKYEYHYIGNWKVKDTGYVAFTFKGVSKTGDLFANISDLELQGPVTASGMNYVKNNDGNFFYWGRRGPSVHLSYVVPDSINAEWFYNEVTVPKGDDVQGSYFMACGFAEGYFGMQVNSNIERHVLFSVWSPFKTDDPKAIPPDQRIVLLKKGDNVHAGEFGSEGSGGQSYLNYMWKAGNTYKFLVHACPNTQGRTEYTAYFYAPELGKWQLIASFSRPNTDTYLKHLHSFLENFEPEWGVFTREVHFNNEWIRTDKGKWIELSKARFTGDNTAAIGYRMDYAGGVDGNSFYLKNCGFFSDYTPRNIYFQRPAGGKKPDIDLGKLP
ncbi:MAG TPA: DUF3472 domain-containing protein [Mucilaginibacter sp.]|nr:DUF3472 domain-containing protein [Mucilaginibacter sp.]